MQWILTNKKCLISIGISWLLLTQMFIVDAADILSSRTGDYCVLPVGDIDGDGRTDHSVSKIADDFGVKAVTYILFGDQSLSADNFSVEYLTTHAGHILHGVATAPFACVPGWVSSARHEGVASAPNHLSLVSKRLNTETSSPIDKPIYYTAVDLTHFGFVNTANGINSRGEVVGGSRAFIYDGEIHYLGTLGGDSSTANEINSLGHVAGYSLTGETDEFGLIHRAFLFDGFSMLDLGLPSYSAAFGLNDADQIVGASYFNLDKGRLYRGFIYQNGETTILGTLGGLQSEASAINLSGQVVGSADGFLLRPDGASFPSTRAFLYESGAMQDLGSLGFSCYEINKDINHESYIRCYERSKATDVNNRGQIVGFSTTNEYLTHAFLAENSVLKDLGTLGGQQSWAYAINDSGQIAGTSLTGDDAAYHGFLFDQNTMYDLNDLIIDLPINSSIWGVSDINNFGQIVGINGYLLNPIYENFTPEKQFFFSDTLGRELNFEYWFSSENISRCHALARVEILFENVTEGREHRWLPADKFVSTCGDFKNWRTASVSVPKALVGKSATVRIRVRTFRTNKTLTVYMRHFSKARFNIHAFGGHALQTSDNRCQRCGKPW